ncbi:hypothetical protein TraAM80_05598 [Trypanosoma rangeli]|uniref:Uncharacterized protein n=1 Tax=Trypanosoma rangeli TaxID=5698 RepID=A0A3R7KY56_TRYRA|nr:uncharacterized protein TraAM80_05598 [Trypanosoma rangeli]RNF03657.1 hypothetical protein TraAM80_05598 [Trypanosoma rangeli]|eukprot:RNF03657.1 hypothetical protein TraAM80_05598 [Trypanosoma rangeli]
MNHNLRICGGLFAPTATRSVSDAARRGVRYPAPRRVRDARGGDAHCRAVSSAARTAWLMNGGVGESSGHCLRRLRVSLRRGQIAAPPKQVASACWGFGTAALLAPVGAVV